MKDNMDLYNKKEYSMCQENFTTGQSEKSFQQFEKMRDIVQFVCAERCWNFILKIRKYFFLTTNIVVKKDNSVKFPYKYGNNIITWKLGSKKFLIYGMHLAECTWNELR